MRYRIVQRTYYNEYGNVTSDYYTIRIKTRWWGWKTVSDPYTLNDVNEPIKFSYIEEAQKYAEEYVLTKLTKSKWVSTVVFDSEDLRQFEK